SQAMAFTERPADLDLPNLDRFVKESFYATAAEPPAGSTVLSLPSLTIGERVLSALPDGPRNSLLKTASHPEGVACNSTPKVLDNARSLGFNTAVVGWSNPYCRILNRSLTQCYWIAQALVPGAEQPFRPESLLASMRDRIRLQFAILPLIGRV